MPTFEVTGPDGKKYRVDAPEGATADDALARVKQQYSSRVMANQYDGPQIGGSLGAFAAGAAQGAVANFGDELLAAPVSAITGKGYGESLEGLRGTLKGIEQESPLSYAGGMIAGSILGPGKVIGGAVKKTMGAIPRFARYAAEGGGIGALEGAGMAEGGIERRAIGLGTGLAGGAAIGSLLPAVGELAYRGGSALVRPLLDRIGDRAVTGAGRELAKAAEISGLKPASIMTRLSRRGPDATLADVSPAFKNLGQNVAQGSPRGNVAASLALDARQRMSPDRMTKAVKENIGDGQFYDLLDDLGEQQRKNSSPLYEAAFANQQPVASTVIDELWGRPDFQDGVKQGIRIIKNEHAGGDASGRLTDAMFEGFEEGTGDLNLLFKQVPSLRVLDAGKRGLDAKITAETDPITGKMTQLGRSFEIMRSRLVKELDRLTTIDGKSLYAEARAAWAGPATLKDAAWRGRKAIGNDPEVIKRTMDKMSPSELEAFRVGAAKELMERINAKDFNADTARALFNSPKMQKTLRLLAPNRNDFADMAKVIANEMNYASTRRVVSGGSQTAFRTAMREETDNPEIATIAGNMLGGNFGTAVANTARAAYRRVTGPSTPVLDQLAPLLFSTDRAKQRAAMKLLDDRYPAAALAHRRGMAALVAGARTGGGLSTQMQPMVQNQSP